MKAKNRGSKPRVSSISSRKPVRTSSAGETRALGRDLASRLRPGDVVFLKGDLGSGKTTFVQGVASGMGVRGFVRSSSFIIANEYPCGRGTLYHLDLYRLSAAEAADVGLEEYCGPGSICLVEWAERAAGFSPVPRWEVDFEWLGDESRGIRLSRIHGRTRT